jgi:hypothetical protein
VFQVRHRELDVPETSEDPRAETVRLNEAIESGISRARTSTPATAGRSSERAMMAACDVALPSVVQKPRILLDPDWQYRKVVEVVANIGSLADARSAEHEGLGATPRLATSGGPYWRR